MRKRYIQAELGVDLEQISVCFHYYLDQSHIDRPRSVGENQVISFSTDSGTSCKSRCECSAIHRTLCPTVKSTHLQHCALLYFSAYTPLRPRLF